MAKLVCSMNQSLDGYVDHDRFRPDEVLFRHFIDEVGGLTGSLYGRRFYELMSYWDHDDPEWGEDEHAFAAAWRGQPKWVVSSTMSDLGPNATLVEGDLHEFIHRLKTEQEGLIEVAGPRLANSIAPLIDEYQIYLHPVVLGDGVPYFAGPRPPLRLVSSEQIGESVVRLVYVPG